MQDSVDDVADRVVAAMIRPGEDMASIMDQARAVKRAVRIITMGGGSRDVRAMLRHWPLEPTTDQPHTIYDLARAIHQRDQACEALLFHWILPMHTGGDDDQMALNSRIRLRLACMFHGGWIDPNG